MMRNPVEIVSLQRAHRRAHPLTLAQKYAMLNAMYEEARRLGKIKVRKAETKRAHPLARARTMNAGV